MANEQRPSMSEIVDGALKAFMDSRIRANLAAQVSRNMREDIEQDDIPFEVAPKFDKPASALPDPTLKYTVWSCTDIVDEVPTTAWDYVRAHEDPA